MKLLNSNHVEYLLIGGYAVNYHGYARTTGDMDIWIALSAENAARTASALRDFGYKETTPEMFASPGRMIRMGIPPLRLEILTSVSGVEFSDCYARREIANIDDVCVPVINIADLKRNKRASGRLKDLADLEELE